MPSARRSQISLDDTPYYHCVSRCVRRTFLCGEDPLSGRSYEHRKAWVEDRLLRLAEAFAIDICAYAVMSNHTHVVLRVDAEKARKWSQQEVIERWHKLHKGTLLSKQWLNPNRRTEMRPAQCEVVKQTAEVWRTRLYDISWFMRSLNEFVARRANKEDECTGRFWEGRFSSQALLDEAALAACMAYVDLNPVRAKLAENPETSEHTSIKRRIHAALQGKQPQRLLPFVGNPRQSTTRGLLFELKDYLELVDLTGRRLQEDKRGTINTSSNPILQRLEISEQNWQKLCTEFEQCFRRAAGSEKMLRLFGEHTGRKRIHGVSQARQWLDSA